MNKRFLVKMFTRYERFWHWSQAILIFVLLDSGFAIRGLLPWIDFKLAVIIHTSAAFLLLLLWLSIIFWHFTTDNWKHYLPTVSGMWPVLRFYAYGIFKHEKHPYSKRYLRKYNPLQALTYSGVKLVLFPTIWVSGLFYLSYPFWSSTPYELLAWVANIHVLAAFGVFIFFMLHMYVLAMGGSFLHHIRPMLTGFDEVELSPVEEAYFNETCVVDVIEVKEVETKEIDK